MHMSIYIHEACAWTPNRISFAMIMVESQGLPNMKCQTKCAKAHFVSLIRHRDSRSARNGCHRYLWSLGKWAVTDISGV
jgi:hypothetical protein